MKGRVSNNLQTYFQTTTGSLVGVLEPEQGEEGIHIKGDPNMGCQSPSRIRKASTWETDSHGELELKCV